MLELDGTAEVSVVITTYNRPDRLEKALRTVLNQTYKKIEIVVIDGANSIKNKEVIDKFNNPKIHLYNVEPRYVKAKSWIGVQHARNVGCKFSKGKYIAMLDDDDEWDRNKIKEQINIFKKDKEEKIGIVLCYSQIINGNGNSIDETKQDPNYKDLLKSFNIQPTSTFMIRRSILEEVGWWNESLRGMHEYDIALKMAKKNYRIVTIPKPLMFRHRIASKKSSYYYIKIAEVMDMWENYGKDFIPYIGFKGFVFNGIKLVALFGLFLSSYIIKDRVWNILHPFKFWFEQKEGLP